MNFIEHSFRVWSTTISAQICIEASFINDRVETSIFKLETPNIHLFINKLRISFFVILLHLFNHCKGYVYVLNVLISIFKHFFTKFRVSATGNKNLEVGLDVLCDHVLNSRISLIPIEWFFILLVSLFPIFRFSVLCHYNLNL